MKYFHRKRKAVKMKVIKKLKSPYGLFADVGEIVEYTPDTTIVEYKNMAMVLPFHKRYIKKLNIIEKIKFKHKGVI